MRTLGSRAARASAIGVVLGAAWTGIAIGQTPTSAPTAEENAPTTWIDESVEVRVVTLDVTATDRSGKPVTDLRREDFELREDGKPIAIVNFAPVGGASAAVAATSPSVAPAPSAGTPAPAEPAPATVLFLDDTHLAPAHRARLIAQLREPLLAGALGDRLAVLTLDRDGVHVRAPLGASPTEVAAVLAGLPPETATGYELTVATKTMLDLLRDRQRMAYEGPRWDSDPPCSVHIASIPQEFARQVESETRGVLHPLSFVLDSLAALPGRKHLFYLTDGLPLQAGIEGFEALRVLCDGTGARQGIAYSVDVESDPKLRDNPLIYRPSQATMDGAQASIASALAEITEHANAANVAMQTVQASGLAAGNPEASEGGSRTTTAEERSAAAANLRDPLSSMASATGGSLVVDTNDVGEAVAATAAVVRQGYVLGFSPERKGDDRLHRLELKTSRPGVTLRYRQAYRDESPAMRVAQEIRGALLHGLWRDPWGATLEARPLPGAVGLRLTLPLEHFGALPAAGGGRQGELTIYVAVRGDDGTVTPIRKTKVPVKVTQPGQPFVYELRIARPVGEHTVALLLRDDIGGDSALLHKSFQVLVP